MPFYSYSYICEKDKKKHEKTVFSKSQHELYDLLMIQDIVPLSIKEKKCRKKIKFNTSHTLALLFETLHGYSEGQINLQQSLELIALDPAFDCISFELSQIKQLTENGQDLDKSFALFPSIFPEQIIYILQSAKKYGNLEKGFKQCSQLIKKKELLKNKLIKTFFYPAFLLLMLFSFLALLFFSLIPSLKESFPSSSESGLSMLFSISDFMSVNFWPISIFMLSIVFSFSFFYRFNKHFHQNIKNLFYHLPILKEAFLYFDLSHYSCIAQSFCESGCPLKEGLAEAIKSCSFPSLINELKKINSQFESASHISQTQKTTSLIPHFFFIYIKIAEQSGNFTQAFQQIHIQSDKKLHESLEKIEKIYGNFLILIIGAIIAGTFLGLVTPMLNPANLVQI